MTDGALLTKESSQWRVSEVFITLKSRGSQIPIHPQKPEWGLQENVHNDDQSTQTILEAVSSNPLQGQGKDKATAFVSIQHRPDCILWPGIDRGRVCNEVPRGSSRNKLAALAKDSKRRRLPGGGQILSESFKEFQISCVSSNAANTPCLPWRNIACV